MDTLNGKTKKMLLLLEKWDGARIKGVSPLSFLKNYPRRPLIPLFAYSYKAAKNLNHFSEWASQIETDLHKVDRLLKKMPSD